MSATKKVKKIPTGRANTRHPSRAADLNPPQPAACLPKPPKRYGILFFETFAMAKTAESQIKQACREVDQLNLAIKAEGNMDDPEILAMDPKVKLFAGAAWWSIHERRQTDGWYNSSH